MGHFLLATEEAGFGLHFDLLESNLVNLVIIIGVLVYFGKGFLGKILNERRDRIQTAIKEAEGRAKTAAESLADAQQKLAEAQKEAERIIADAQKRAESAKQEILAQNAQEIERMKASSAQEMNTERDRVIAELRSRVAAMALENVEGQLRDRLNDDRQKDLVDRSIAQIGG